MVTSESGNGDEEKEEEELAAASRVQKCKRTHC